MSTPDPPRVRCHWILPDELYFAITKSLLPALTSEDLKHKHCLNCQLLPLPRSKPVPPKVRCHWIDFLMNYILQLQRHLPVVF